MATVERALQNKSRKSTPGEKEFTDRILNLARAFHVFDFTASAAVEYAAYVGNRCKVEHAMKALDTEQWEHFPYPPEVIEAARRIERAEHVGERLIKIERTECGSRGDHPVQRMRKLAPGQKPEDAVKPGEKLIRVYPDPDNSKPVDPKDRVTKADITKALNELISKVSR